MSQDKLLIGALEIANLPELGISDLKIRVDTGAQTSSLHVDNIRTVKKNGKPWVKFDIHPNLYNVDEVIRTEAKLKDVRWIKSSNGSRQQRYVIETLFQIGQREWPIQITLTDRSDMTYLMLFGREGMGSHVLVDPSQTFICGENN
ncbi:transglutaminase [Catenovulum agarivorans DS-2]|uniref:Transglutaminase n=1 Tax=Catenovulum agarivorans DS-2 TaxID=1328313 RepID=W7QSV8_9ALTE|nr:ATP-dependent zinc protease [Catenovulum agarivorans]EWH12097.1 transglutaminase [Catenovulum agarivorans DS-2]